MASKQVKDWFLKNGLPFDEEVQKCLAENGVTHVETLFNDPENEAEDEFPEDEAEDEDGVEEE